MPESQVQKQVEGEEPRTVATGPETLRVRALLGRWEGQEIILCGCSPAFEHLDESDWNDRVQLWKNEAPAGTGEWLEAWLTVEADHSIFTPQALGGGSLTAPMLLGDPGQLCDGCEKHKRGCVSIGEEVLCAECIWLRSEDEVKRLKDEMRKAEEPTDA